MRQKGFGIVEIVVIVGVVLVVGVLGWFLYGVKQGRELTREKLQTDRILIKEWGVTIPQIAPGEVVLANNFDSQAYGSALDSLNLYLPSYDNRFTCAVDVGQEHKAVFAAVARYNLDTNITGPFTPDKVIAVDDKKFALFSAGMNCFNTTDAERVRGIYTEYINSFSVEGEKK